MDFKKTLYFMKTHLVKDSFDFFFFLNQHHFCAQFLNASIVIKNTGQ